MRKVRAGQTRFTCTKEVYRTGAGNFFAVPCGEVRKVFIVKVVGGKVTYRTEKYAGEFTTSVERILKHTKQSRKSARNLEK